MARFVLRSLAAAVLLLASGVAVRAQQLPPDVLYGYKTYFKYHAPKNKEVRHNLYPFAGPIIPYGQDIPICAAARTEEAYEKKRDIRYLLHGKDGWIYRTIDFRSDFKATPQALDYFARLNGLLEARGQTLVVVFQPPRGLAEFQHTDAADVPKGYTPEKAKEGYESFLKQLHDAGIVTVDLTGGPDGYFSKGDFHWAPLGAGYSAQKVADVIKNLSAFDGIPRHKFETTIAGMAAASRGVFEEFIQNTCKENIELTTQPVWRTDQVDAAANSLLGDTPVPAITMLGTSNSAEDDKFNFVGALKHDLGADVFNAAETAGGFGSSPSRYFASDLYRSHPPRIIAWEFLPQHNYNNQETANFFREMIPAIYGACDAKSALAQYSAPIKSEVTTILPGNEKLSLKDSYLYLDVSNPTERNLKLEILYADGNADQVDLTRSTRAENNGKYYFELSHGTDNKPLFFHLVTDTTQGQVTARICHYPVTVAEK